MASIAVEGSRSVSERVSGWGQYVGLGRGLKERESGIGEMSGQFREGIVIVRVTLYTPGGYVTVVYDLTDNFLFIYYILLLCINKIIYIRYYYL